MFERERLIGSKESGIVVQTTKGVDVANSQAAAPSQKSVERFNRIRSKHLAWRVRKPPCGIYNCYGHVWAARRTAIYDDAEVNKILHDDEYRKLKAQEIPVEGDIAIYYDPSGKGLVHAGLVCNVTTAKLGTKTSFTTYVLSKLNDSGGEVFHRADDFHNSYESFEGGPLRLEYWTDRPQDPQ